LGVVTKVTLDLQPAYLIQQESYEKLPLTEVDDHFEAIMGAGYSVSFFPTWQYDWIDSVLVKRRLVDERAVAAPADFFGATRVAQEGSADDWSDRYGTPKGIPGPWHERLPHFYFKDALLEGNELQSEYFVKRKDAVAAMRAVARLGQQMASFLQISEIRTVAADQLWLSPAYQQDVVGIHFNWHKNWAAVAPFLPILEEQLAPFQPCPHWGKLFALSPAQVQASYPRLADFRALLRHYDPQGKFRNAFLEKYVGG
jgi:xylitol oxidase